MEATLLKDILSKKTLDAYIQNKGYAIGYHANFFPMATTNRLDFQTLIGENHGVVAADIISYNASAPEKERRVINKISGDIPKTAVKRKMKEQDLLDYLGLAAHADADQKKLLDFVFNDVDFVFNGVNARMEWMVLQAMSTGQMELDKDNNVGGVITETAINFNIPDDNKTGVAVTWGSGASATPLTDMREKQTDALAVGVNLKYVFMRREQFNQMKTTTQVKEEVGFYLTGQLTLEKAPNLKTINAFLLDEALPQIVIIDSAIGLAGDDGSITYSNPWSLGKICYVPEIKQGNMLRAPSAEEISKPKQVLQTKRNGVLISKYSTVDPLTEWTKGEANVFPSWPSVDSVFLQNTAKVDDWS